MFNSIIPWSLKNRWLVTGFAVLVFIYGLISSFKLPIDVFPDFAPVQVVVQTEAPGFAPLEVENQVTIPLESSLNGIAGLKQVRSLSSTGISVLTLIFEDGIDVFKARQLVSEKLQIVRGELAPGIEQPLMTPITTAVGDIIKIGLIAEQSSLMELRTLADWTLARRLMAVSGVSNVVVYGGDTKQYQVLVDPNKLKDFDISLAEAVRTISESNINASGGILRNPDKEYLIRGLGRVNSVEDIENTVIKTKAGFPVLIKNIATVKIAAAQKIGEALINGKPGIILNVSKQPWANTLELTHKIEKVIAGLKASFPKDVKVITVFRQADFIELAVHNMLEALLLGSVLVIIVLFFFLNNWRTAFISLTAIPISLLIAVISLKWQGATINTMTLGGLAIAIGEVVDDAIIDVENVHRRLQENKQLAEPRPVFEVILEASKEIRGSVIYATFIIALVFMPILSLTGLEGKIFTPLAFSFIVAILASLAVALTLTPALCYLLLNKAESLDHAESELLIWLKAKYEKILSFALANAKKLISASMLIFAVSLLPLFFLGKTFLPEFDESNLIVGINSVPGTSLDLTTQTGKVLTEHLIGHDEVLSIGQRAGRAPGADDYGMSNFSEFDIRLSKGSGTRHKILEHIRDDFAKVPGIVINVGSYISHRMDHVLSGVNAPIAIKVFGSDLDVLYKKAREIETVFKTVNGAVDVQVEPIIPIPQIAIAIKRDAAARYGLTVGELTRSIEVAFKGKAVSKVLEGQKSFDLVVWFEEKFRQDIDTIKSVLIDTPAGKVPIATVAEVKFDTTPNTIKRDNVSRRVVIQANVFGRDLGAVISEVRAKVQKQIQLPSGYYIEYGGQFEAQEKATKQLIILSFVAVLGIYLLLMMAFKSPQAAALVLANLPLALIGGIWAIVFSGGTLSVGSLVGFITLFGISSRNGIMLVSHFKHMLEAGKSFDEVIWQGSLDRLSPVLMTAFTAALGVLPIAIMGGAGRELEQPLAIVILGGMISSTVLTLLLIPALFKLCGAQALGFQSMLKKEND
jgi:CzcA family heavy metal efflux pump